MTNAPPTQPRAPDWGVGCYEHTAAQLLPAAETLVARAAVASGDRVVDVGCGTGNAALLAAARGARVTGVDPAVRLLEVARRESASRGLDTTFVTGTAAAMPLEDGTADVVLSSFGVIFAPDPGAAADEMARVASSRGRIVLSAWLPEGTFFELVRLRRQAVNAAPRAPAALPAFAWHDRDSLARLFAPHRFRVELSSERLIVTAASAGEYLEREFENHPLSIASLSVLQPLGRVESLRARALEILEAGNEDSSAFRVTTRYIIATARR